MPKSEGIRDEEKKSRNSVGKSESLKKILCLMRHSSAYLKN